MKDQELKKLLDDFIDKPTEENLQLINKSARKYTSEWIEAGGRTRKLSSKGRTTYNRIHSDGNLTEEGNYMALQDKIEDDKDPYKVISFRRRDKYSSKGPIHNRRFYFQKYPHIDGKHFWFYDYSSFVDGWLGPVYSGWFDYEDHRRPNNPKLEDQFIYSEKLSKQKKEHYLGEIVKKDEIANFMQEEYSNDSNYFTFFNMIDDIEFVIDLYAGDTSEGQDGSDTRKALISIDIYGSGETAYTIRSLTKNQNKKNKFSKPIHQDSEWSIENSMPDISPQTAEKFWDYFNGGGVKIRTETKYKINPNYELRRIRSNINLERLKWLGTEGKTMDEIINSRNPYHDHPTIKSPLTHLNWDIKQRRVIKD
tara:strand:- start:216 stop:1313 length:1098 start_codon:yes stop_codon:yes gene_type:complete